MLAPAPIARKSLTDQVVPLLRDLIIAGELKPGDKIPEAALCLRFGVSRAPLREALKVLASEGLVVLSAHRGAAIAKISREDVDELFPILGALEALAGEGVVAVADDKDIKRLETLHREIVYRYSKRDWVAYAKANRSFHVELFSIAGNRALQQMYEQLIVRIHAVRFVVRRSDARWAEAVDDHERIMEALRKRNQRAVARHLKAHLARKADVVREALAHADAVDH